MGRCAETKKTKNAFIRFRWLALLAGCSTLSLAGCSRHEPSPPYQALSGVVRAIDCETGELLIRAERPPDRNLVCVVTKDSELYVNDRFSDLREVRIDDALDAIAYRDRDRFVLSLVNIRRSEPAPPAPAFLLKVTTQPASSDKHED
ncbi:MAG: hypothetical protein KBH81_04745 [Phycisphaerae bacterium]|jgi:hypothetical protein|nr:hypothetical protein [Phycisphaerae bacterium]